MKSNKNKYTNILKKYNPLILKAAENNISKNINSNMVLGETVSYVVAPVLFDFVYWILSEAKNQGIYRLYFFARDGYILYNIAKYINEKFMFQIDCRYLYTSRFASRVPSFHLLGNKSFDIICEKKMFNSIRTVLQNISLNLDEQKHLINLLRLSNIDLDKELNLKELESLKMQMISNNDFVTYVFDISKNAYSKTIQYFQQEGLFDSVSMGYVDVGWRGTLQVFINRLINKNLPGFYFGLFSSDFLTVKDNCFVYMFSNINEHLFKAFFNNSLFECFCSAPDGMTVGYEYIGTKWEPSFSNKNNINLKSWYLKEQIELILNYTKEILDLVDSYKNNKKMSKLLLRNLMAFPTKDEALLYGKYLFSDETNEESLITLAPEFTKSDCIFLLTKHLRNTSKCAHKLSYWRFGSIQLSSINSCLKVLVWWYCFLAKLYKNK